MVYVPIGCDGIPEGSSTTTCSLIAERLEGAVCTGSADGATGSRLTLNPPAAFTTASEVAL